MAVVGVLGGKGDCSMGSIELMSVCLYVICIGWYEMRWLVRYVMLNAPVQNARYGRRPIRSVTATAYSLPRRRSERLQC